MDKKAFGEVEARLLEVNEVVKKLDDSIRVAAFDFLKSYIAGGDLKTEKHTPAEKHGAGAGAGGSTDDFATFVQEHNTDDADPSDTAKMLSAWWFSQHGSEPFTLKWLKATGSSTGLTIPGNPGMTFVQAAENGKLLYESLGTGKYKPTISGELYLKKTYKISKGTKPLPTKEAK